MVTTFVDTVNGIMQLIDIGLPAGTSLLYVDVQGRKPACQNSISLMIILPAQSNTIYIVDVDNLGDNVFTIPGSGGRTMRSILESSDITKVFFSMQNSRQLYADYRICLQGAENIHIMENL
jgi:exonuclease 3'-5' domain-containing protein 1